MIYLLDVKALVALGFVNHEFHDRVAWVRAQNSSALATCSITELGFVRVLGAFSMKRMAAGSFKVHCLAVMDEVQAKRKSVVIAKYGKPVAKLVPADRNTDDIYNFLAGKGAIAGDVVSPAISEEEWGESSDSVDTHVLVRLAFDQGYLSKAIRAAINEARQNGQGLGISDIMLLE